MGYERQTGASSTGVQVQQGLCHDSIVPNKTSCQRLCDLLIVLSFRPHGQGALPLQEPGAEGFASILRQIKHTVNELLGTEVPSDQVYLTPSDVVTMPNSETPVSMSFIS